MSLLKVTLELCDYRHIRQFEEFSRNDANAVKVVIVDCIGDIPLQQVIILFFNNCAYITIVPDIIRSDTT